MLTAECRVPQDTRSGARLQRMCVAMMPWLHHFPALWKKPFQQR
jgi:hypothetical protein